MSFFRNDPTSPPPEGAPEAEGESPSHSARSRPLFKQEPSPLTSHLPAGRMSLSDYIARHFEEGAGDALPNPSAVLETLPPVESALSSSRHAGVILNSLDVELASGLEQYLPTPAFRLKVVKKRLRADIRELRARLSQYEGLAEQSPEIRGAAEALRDRLARLEAYEADITRQFLTLFRGGGLIYRLVLWVARCSQWRGFDGSRPGRWLGRLIYGKDYVEIENDGAHLNNLLQLLRRRLDDKTAPDTEISQLMNQYEQALHRAETAAVRFRSK